MYTRLTLTLENFRREHVYIRILDLHNGPSVNEQASQVNRFRQATSTVSRKIEYNRVNIFGFKIFQNSSHISCRTFEIGQTFSSCAHIHVEAGEVNDSNLVALPIGLFAEWDDFTACFAILQFDLRTCDFIDFNFVAAGRFDTEPYHGTGLTANHLHNIV